MLENFDILCFGPGDWWGMNPSCTVRSMVKLSVKNRIVYVNPVSSDLMGVSGKRGLIARIIRKFRSLAKFIRKSNRNLYVISPVFLPIQGNWLIDKMNNCLILAQIKLLLTLINFNKPIFWIENLRAADFLSSINPQLTIFHVSDHFTECAYTKNKTILHQREENITANSDLIICVSRELYKSKKIVNRKVFYLPHGVDYENFREAAEKQPCFDKVCDIKGPIAGYFGTLTAQNDIELLEYCAKQLPNVTFVFAGQITAGNYRDLSLLPNVFFLGKIPYEQIPSLCSSFDVCLLPWKLNQWIKDCNPLKLFEYMASGKPIVSVPIAEIVEKYSELLSVANTKEQFCESIVWELENDTIQRKAQRLSIAKRNSWTEHMELLSRIILGVIDKD